MVISMKMRTSYLTHVDKVWKLLALISNGSNAEEMPRTICIHFDLGLAIRPVSNKLPSLLSPPLRFQKIGEPLGLDQYQSINIKISISKQHFMDGLISINSPCFASSFCFYFDFR